MSSLLTGVPPTLSAGWSSALSHSRANACARVSVAPAAAPLRRHRIWKSFGDVDASACRPARPPSPLCCAIAGTSHIHDSEPAAARVRFAGLCTGHPCRHGVGCSGDHRPRPHALRSRIPDRPAAGLQQLWCGPGWLPGGIAPPCTPPRPGAAPILWLPRCRCRTPPTCPLLPAPQERS